jgi:O-antigen ligase
MLYSLGTIFAGPLGFYSQQSILSIRRPQVFGSSSSNLGLLLVFFVCVAFGQALYTKRRGAALGWWLLTFIFCIAVVLSFGRTAWLTLCLSALVMLSLYTRNIAILPFILVLLLLSFIPGVSDFFNPGKVYGSDRLIMWQDAIDIWLRHPSFGIGAGNYQFFDLAYGKDIGGVAHNQYLEVLAEMGVQGLLCLLWSILVTGYLAFKRFRSATTALGKAFALSYMGYYIGLIFFGFFGDSFLPSVAGAGGTAAIIEASYNWFLFGVVLTIPQWERLSRAAVTAEICQEERG